MSFREVNSLRREGRLDEAFKLAETDLQAEDSSWSRSAMFWVLRDYFNSYLSQGNMEDCNKTFLQMQEMLSGMDDEDGYAERAIKHASECLCPNSRLLHEASELSRNGHEEEAYDKVMEIHAKTPIEDLLHEQFAWIIFRYLKKEYNQIGSLNARKILFTYMQLHNERPSLVHSQILNLASKISERYNDFKFLPFLQMWGVNNFTDEDLRESYSEGKTFQPLYIRIFRRCISLRYNLDECLAVFCQNPGIGKKQLLVAYSQQNYFDIFNLSKESPDGAFNKIVQYANECKGEMSENEYHSKIIRSFLFLSKENINSKTKEILEAFGFDKFLPEDWSKEINEKGDKPYPSLVERFIKTYNDSMAMATSRIPDRDYEQLIKKAIEKYPEDDQFPRYLAKADLSWGNRDLALQEYRKLLIKNNKFYLWKELSLITDNRELKYSALCKAISSEPKDEFLGEVHLLLANLLIEDKEFGRALNELNQYASTYARNSWPLKSSFLEAQQKIPQGTQPSESNLDFYQEHSQTAEEFVYSEIPWTTMAVIDIFEKLKENGKKSLRAKLVSSEGKTITINVRQLGCVSTKPHLKDCYDIKLSEDGKRAALVKPSNHNVKEILKEKIGFVEYYNEEKKLAHVYDTSNNHYIISHMPFSKDMKFIIFLAVPINKQSQARNSHYGSSIQTSMEDHQISHAIFSHRIKYNKYKEALEHFPEIVGVVDCVNKEKELFHCVFGKGNGTIIRFSETNIRPCIADVIIAHYIVKKDKENKNRIQLLDIKVDDSKETPLVKVVKGTVRTSFNVKGKRFGFVEDYYIPEYLLNGVADGDVVSVKVVFDGDKWRAVSKMPLE